MYFFSSLSPAIATSCLGVMSHNIIFVFGNSFKEVTKLFVSISPPYSNKHFSSALDILWEPNFAIGHPE